MRKPYADVGAEQALRRLARGVQGYEFRSMVTQHLWDATRRSSFIRVEAWDVVCSVAEAGVVRLQAKVMRSGNSTGGHGHAHHSVRTGVGIGGVMRPLVGACVGEFPRGATATPRLLVRRRCERRRTPYRSSADHPIGVLAAVMNKNVSVFALTVC